MKLFIKHNYKKILRLLLAIYLVSVGALIQIIWSTPYFGIIKTEESINGVIDFTGDDLTTKIANSFTYGDVEFFYNEWIVSDDEIKNEGIMIKIPSRWTGLDYNGTKLPKTGYGSYRFYLKGIPKGSTIRIWLDNDTAYRLYYNGELVGQVGDVYKDRLTTNYNKNFNQLYTVTTDEIEVVVEIGYSMAGGIIILPFFSSIDRGENPYTNFIASFIYIAIGLAIILFIFCIVFDVLKHQKTKLSIIMLGIILFFYSSFDLVYVFRNFDINVSVRLFEIVHFFTLLLLFGIIYFFLLKKSDNKINKYFYLYLLCDVLNYAIFIVLYGTRLLFISFILLFIIQTAFYIVFFRNYEVPYSFKFLLICIMSLMFAIMLDFCDMIVYSLWSIYSFYMFVIYADIIYILVKKISELAQYDIKNKFLEYQIECVSLNLHSEKNYLGHISNSINDESLVNSTHKYAEYLNTKNSYMLKYISFKREIEFTKLYVDSLVNFHSKLNTDEVKYFDFLVPSFIIQPIVENAIKHGGIRDSNQYIKIKSEIIDDYIYITISNNGLKFDMKKMDNRLGVGINNVIQRLRYLYSDCDVKFKSDVEQHVLFKINPKSIQNLDKLEVEN